MTATNLLFSSFFYVIIISHTYIDTYYLPQFPYAIPHIQHRAAVHKYSSPNVYHIVPCITSLLAHQKFVIRIFFFFSLLIFLSAIK